MISQIDFDLLINCTFFLMVHMFNKCCMPLHILFHYNHIPNHHKLKKNYSMFEDTKASNMKLSTLWKTNLTINKSWVTAIRNKTDFKIIQIYKFTNKLLGGYFSPKYSSKWFIIYYGMSNCTLLSQKGNVFIKKKGEN